MLHAVEGLGNFEKFSINRGQLPYEESSLINCLLGPDKGLWFGNAPLIHHLSCIIPLDLATWQLHDQCF
jgi:hypothetical protein